MLLARTTTHTRRIRSALQKRHYSTPEQRSRRALRTVVAGALFVGYTAGWVWRGVASSRASWRRSGG